MKLNIYSLLKLYSHIEINKSSLKSKCNGIRSKNSMILSISDKDLSIKNYLILKYFWRLNLDNLAKCPM